MKVGSGGRVDRQHEQRPRCRASGQRGGEHSARRAGAQKHRSQQGFQNQHCRRRCQRHAAGQGRSQDRSAVAGQFRPPVRAHTDQQPRARDRRNQQPGSLHAARSAAAIRRLNASPTNRASGANASRVSDQQVGQVQVGPVEVRLVMGEQRGNRDSQARGDQCGPQRSGMPGFQHDPRCEQRTAERHRINRTESGAGRTRQQDLAVAGRQSFQPSMPKSPKAAANWRGAPSRPSDAPEPTSNTCSAASMPKGSRRNPLTARDGRRQWRDIGSGPQYPPAQPGQCAADHRPQGSTDRAAAGDPLQAATRRCSGR